MALAPPARTLDKGSLHLWLVTDPRPISFPERLLSPEEQKRFRETTHIPTRDQFALSRVLMRHVLSDYCHVEASNLKLESLPTGQLRIAPEQNAANLSFSLTHTEGLVALAVASGCDVGLDGEQLRTPPDLKSVASGIFSVAEMVEMRSLHGMDHSLRFFQYWTLKESLAKALGLGFSFPLNRVEFSIAQNNAVEARFDALVDSSIREARWTFALHRPTEGHLLATAVRHRDSDWMTSHFFTVSSYDL